MSQRSVVESWMLGLREITPLHRQVLHRFRVLKEDTQLIGVMLNIPESQVYNFLAQAENAKMFRRGIVE